MLYSLLAQTRTIFTHKETIKILVIGAGIFPSFNLIKNTLNKLLPTLSKITFILVDPAKYKTDQFLKSMTNDVKTDVQVQNLPLQEFLNNYHQQDIDIIYFEHTDFRTFRILLANIVGIYKNTIKLRYAIPYLAKIMSKKALIIASCISLQELFQLKYLLKLSFNLDSCTIIRNKNILYSGYYGSGLFLNIQNLSTNLRLQKKRSHFIKKSDVFLCLAILIVGIIGFTAQLNILLLLLILILQLLAYRPGKIGIVINLFFAVMISIFWINH